MVCLDATIVLTGRPGELDILRMGTLPVEDKN